MTTAERSNHHRDQQKSKSPRVISPTVVSAFMSATGVPESGRAAAETQVRKILRQAKPVGPDKEPKNVTIPAGAHVDYVAHWMRPGVVYRLCTLPGGEQRCDMVIKHDKEGRPGFRK